MGQIEYVTVWNGGELLPPRNGGSAAAALMAEAPVHGRVDHESCCRVKPRRDSGKTSTRDQLLKARRQLDRERIATMVANGVSACAIASVLQMRTCTVSRIVKQL